MGGAGGGASRQAAWLSILATVTAIALVVGLVGWGPLSGDDGEEASGEIFLEPEDEEGPDPFTTSVAKRPSTGQSTTTVKKPTRPGTLSVRGGRPGLFGGTRSDSDCDKNQLSRFLDENPQKRAAWAAAQGVQVDQMPTFLAGLTPSVLTSDTRVTNHGFAAGRATPRQSVLQAGTAVLLDRDGRPRVRCACGNPLEDPQPTSTLPRFRGPEWEGFDPDAVIVVVVASQPLTQFVLQDVDRGDLFVRPVGTSGEQDRDATPADAVVQPEDEPTATTTTSPTATTSPPAAGNIASTGSVSAASTFSAEFPADKAIDGDPTTSWFSAGASDGPVTLYQWDAPGDVSIERITVVGNAAHPQFPTGFGFESVRIVVVDADRSEVFQETVSLAGTPDPDVSVTPGATGRSVLLLFEGRESPDRGGFAELQILSSG